jgi:uncharacterized protein YdeI (YjbR/CyaY-like superfamily)
MSPIDVGRAIEVSTEAELDAWLADRGTGATDVVVAIHNRASGRRTVTLVALQEVALRHGWVDTQTKHIDEARYAIRFVPRRPRSHWSEKNRVMARRLLDAGRMTEQGWRTLPPDL